MASYVADAADALADIKEAGAMVTFPSGTGPVYDGATDTWSADTRVNVTGHAIQVRSDPDRLAALGLVLTNPVALDVAGSGLPVTPTPGMTMTWGGLAYTIKLVESVAPAGPSGGVILYKLTGEV